MKANTKLIGSQSKPPLKPGGVFPSSPQRKRQLSKDLRDILTCLVLSDGPIEEVGAICEKNSQTAEWLIRKIQDVDDLRVRDGKASGRFGVYADVARQALARVAAMAILDKMMEEKLAEDLIARMRAKLEEHARVPFGLPDCAAFFAEHPAESDEILSRLFAEYDAGAGDAVAPDIRALIKLQRVARKYVSRQRSAALTRLGVLRTAYEYPPTSLRAMYLALRGVTHAGDEHEFCEALVRDHPSVAHALMAQLVIEQRHEHFYEMRPGAWHDTAAEIDTLRSMIARTTARRLLDDMDGAQ